MNLNSYGLRVKDQVLKIAGEKRYLFITRNEGVTWLIEYEDPNLRRLSCTVLREANPHFSPIDFFLGLRQFGGLLEMLEASNRVY
jgi:hypothetical protein